MTLACLEKPCPSRDDNPNTWLTAFSLQELNPQFVWGGDAITLDNCDKVWIDHNKFSLIGRQMIVSGWGAAGHVTISDNEFDGKSTWSAGCNGKHYWTMLLLGEKDFYTIAGNWFHDVSGRTPHIGTDYTSSKIVVHAVNNYFQVSLPMLAFEEQRNKHLSSWINVN